MKKRRLLTLLPLIALLLSGCETGDIYIDMGDVDSDSNTQETGEPGTGESSPSDSSPSENTTEGNSPSESNPSEPSSSEGSPSENPSSGETSGSTSGSYTPVITYSLVINNKDSLTSISNSEDNPNTNVYTLDIALYTYTDEIQTEEKSASETDVTITSSNDNAIAVNGLTLILGSESDASVTLTATWNGYDVSDTVNINYTYTPHVEVISYRYELTITNKEALTATWKIDDSGTRTVAVSLSKYTIIDGIEQQNPEIDDSGTDITLTQEGEGEVIITGLDIAPSKVGSLTLSATYQNGDISASDCVEIAIEDSIYEYNYDLTITNKDSIQTTESDPWVYQTGSKTVSITLSYYTYTASTGISEESTLTGTTQNVSISVYDDQGASADSDITYSNSLYGISLSLSAVNSSYYTVVFTWTSHTQASDSLTFYVSEPIEGTTTYSISIDNREALTASWYLGDSDRTLEYSVKATTGEETSDVDLADYIDGISVSTSPEGYVNATLDNTNGAITLSLINVPEDDTTVTVYLKWEEYGITEYVELNLGVHTYKIEITNTEELMADWTIEDEATRTIEYACYIDDTLQELLGLGHVSISSSDEEVVSVDGTTLRAVGEGTPTVTATWYSSEEEIEENILDTDSVLLSINNTIKPASISLNQPESTTLGLNESISITATVLGKDNVSPATDPEVTWESNNPTGISVAVDPTDSTKATVTGLVYSAEATITATCGELSDSIALAVEAEPVVEATPADLVNISYPASVVTSPDDRGVYVLGTENGETYLAYDGTFTTTDSYDSAAAVRVIAVDGGYNLEINDTKVDSTLGLTGDAGVFTLDSGALYLNTTGLYITNNGLDTSGTDKAYLLDLEINETETTTTGGEGYYLSATRNGVTHFASSYDSSNNRFNTSTNVNDAIEFNVENINGNVYYISFMNNGTETFISLDSSNNKILTSTKTETSDPNPIYYDSTNDAWADLADDTTNDKFLLFNSSGEYMNSYAHNNATNSGYAIVELTRAETTPNAKGITLTVDDEDLTCSVGHTFTPSVRLYPSAVETLSPITSSDLTYSQTGTGAVTIDYGNISSSSEGSVIVTATYNGVSDSFTMNISASDGTREEKFGYKLLWKTGSNNGLITSTGGGTFDVGGLTWTYTSLVNTPSNNAKGMQIGTSSNPQTSDWTLSTDFGENVKLKTITINISNANSGAGVYSITLGENNVADSVAFSNSNAEDKTHTYSSGEEPEGQTLSVALHNTTGNHAIYFQYITFTVLVDENSNLSLSEVLD